VEFSSKINVWLQAAKPGWLGGKPDFRSNLFLLIQLKPLSSAGFAKADSQNLAFKELGYQNIENKPFSRGPFAMGEPSLPRL
jgi:hypothetical protein